ncbi:hypothetical protein LEN26_013343 [Aphanomyces euteiches]|nr:hypothetical protein AeMF1_019284 [Aphanomyces euteiches]KAH9111990.1 hypothetical protein LEN26_013343 [Aphanomyces euteiches]KAH9112266.1 hypothetical protein AeMF1_013343 [Aphanomyces euteiches]KAH9121630.1 hypothetical protein AeMF1_006746 [Aphanomyces euteiches]KAH9122151.1 hypothetical protein AeMF1_006437 [Aphanomyces euteiches]
MGKGLKWSGFEDAQLARSWVSVSGDPVKGDDQTSDSFWAAIYAHWISAGCEGRTVQALKNRWTIVNRATQKFAGYFAQNTARRASGKTDEDIVQDSLDFLANLEIVHQVAPSGESSDTTKSLRPIGCKQAKRKATEDNAVINELDKLVRAQEEKNNLFADFMLLQMLQQEGSSESSELRAKLLNKYSKRQRTSLNKDDE